MFLQHWFNPTLGSSLSPGGISCFASLSSINSVNSVIASFCRLISLNKSWYSTFPLATPLLLIVIFLQASKCCWESSGCWSPASQHWRGQSTCPPYKFLKLHLNISAVLVWRANRSFVSSSLNKGLFKYGWISSFSYCILLTYVAFGVVLWF